ncbi:serine/threonine-protein phosphatase [Streptomyces sp. RB6PN25]|uniref:Serine/threonine-protein phosphatase n=1 Tax=Streptomyces humicola TaxID=2953240 RepID=A0ABT1Q1Z4_9ACTN|nr:SpoIIE family protein phosphatase [Streptomyces humicola]MCQ4083954.1 serine/threonine-protein phosphatase [Streptomyces humicola]
MTERGIDAIARVGRLRTVIRTLAGMDLPPDEVLAHIDLHRRPGGRSAAGGR